MANRNEILINEAVRQGEDYSRKIKEEYETLWNQHAWDFLRKERARWMLRTCAPVGTGKTAWNVLEVGCGIGWTAIEVVRQAPWIKTILAIDPSVRALEEAERLKKTAPVEVQKKLAFTKSSLFEHFGGPYDLIYMHEVLEHISDLQAVFSKARDLVNPGGHLAISTPNYNRLDNRIRDILGWKRAIVDPLHVREYAFEELINNPSANGWTCVKGTGRFLCGELLVAGLISLGSRFLARSMSHLAQKLVGSRVNFELGKLLPKLSSELWFLYVCK